MHPHLSYSPLFPPAVSLAERAPELGAPLYEAVLQRVLPHASYPPAFTNWEEEFEVDEDAFKRLRRVKRPGALLRQCRSSASGGCALLNVAVSLYVHMPALRLTCPLRLQGSVPA